MDSHSVIRLEQEMKRRTERLGNSLGVRVDQALWAALCSPTVDAAPVGRESHRGTPGSSPPPPQNSLYQHYERRLTLMVEALERELDAERFRPSSAEAGREGSRSRDERLIRDFEGITSAEVAFIDRTFGSARSVERARVRKGRRPIDGRLSNTNSR